MMDDELPDLGEEHQRLGELTTRMVAAYARELDQIRLCSAATPGELAALFDEPLPRTGAEAADVLSRFESDIAPHSMAISSPRYFGLFNPTPLPVAVWADALASALNQNGAVWRNSPAANVIEARVVRWLCELVGYGANAFGTLTSGGSEANLVGLKCARDAAHASIRDRGLRAAPGDLTVYATEQSHYSIEKSLDILGFGRESLRKISTDEHFHIRVDELRAAIERDRANGCIPCCIAGAAGATSTGVIDPLDQLADLAQEFGVWFQVDAAYGGGLAFSKHRGRLKGIERADSITVDAHKWMFVPFACGALLVRGGAEVLRHSFDLTPEYLTEKRERFGGADEEFDGFRYGQLGTKRFNALKVWAAFKTLGVDGYAEIIDRQIELTQYFAIKIDSLPDFVRLGQIETAVSCFRFLPDWVRGLDGEGQDRVQRELQQRIEASGEAWLATTVLQGRRALRVNVNSFLTRRRHIDNLVELLQRFGAELTAERNAE
jgi:glutamate/tyrosine decarboxylase-like PLP-dependent enzyme